MQSGSTSTENSLRQVDEATVASDVEDEFMLPKRSSLAIVIFSNVLLQNTFFIVVSSSNEYAEYLGGSSTFSGLTIGIPTGVGFLTLLPLTWVDKTVYTRPLHLMCGSMLVGNILYGLAYYANWLYLILIGRMVCGLGYTFWMYNKRYCSDPRIVGVRRRTTLAGWLVLCQGLGFSSGPFFGGLLYKVGFANRIFNGYTSPGWVMAGCWLLFWIAACIWFEDVPLERRHKNMPPRRSIPSPVTRAGSYDEKKDDVEAAVQETDVAVTEAPVRRAPSPAPQHHHLTMTRYQKGVCATMCWFAMTTFFILGAWEANLPIYTASDDPSNPFNFSPYAAGNLIALGGICTMPFLIANLALARRVQDRHTLAMGTSVGVAGLLLAIGIIQGRKVNFGTLWFAWFLIALGFNVASTVTLSLMSKQLPGEWNNRISLMIQYSNYTGRVTGAVFGGAGVKVGMIKYIGVQLAYVVVGYIMFITLWKHMKAKTG